MRGVSIKLLALTLVAATPALAEEGVNCTGGALKKSITPAAVTEALASELDASIGEVAPAQLITAYKSIVKTQPDYAYTLGGMIALARPDVEPLIKAANAELCPAAAAELNQEIDDTSSNPSADELAAIASVEGGIPAAGDGSPH